MAEATPLAALARKRNVLRVAAIAFVGLIGAAVMSYFGLRWRISKQMKPAIMESDEPISLNEARRMSELPIPESAKRIRFAGYSEFQAFTEVLCFEAPIDDCKAFAEKVIEDHNRKNPQRTVKGLRPISPAGSTAASLERGTANRILEPLKASWFTPYSIRSGMQAGEEGSHQPMIWIDLEKGILYYLLTD
jgi:hypothetical protein